MTDEDTTDKDTGGVPGVWSRVDGVTPTRTRDCGARFTLPPGVTLGPALRFTHAVQPSVFEIEYRQGLFKFRR